MGRVERITGRGQIAELKQHPLLVMGGVGRWQFQRGDSQRQRLDLVEPIGRPMLQIWGLVLSAMSQSYPIGYAAIVAGTTVRKLQLGPTSKVGQKYDHRAVAG